MIRRSSRLSNLRSRSKNALTSIDMAGVLMMRRLAGAAFLLSFAAQAFAQSSAAPIQITADLTEAPRGLYHAEVDLPVKAGPLTLITPQWIPGNHRPTGPVEEIS